jgi:hypothetical protein
VKVENVGEKAGSVKTGGVKAGSDFAEVKVQIA